MPIVKRVTESQWSDSETINYREPLEGFWRFVIEKPQKGFLQWNKKGELKVVLQLALTPSEQTRQLDIMDELPPDTQQSARTWYRVNPKLGFFPKGGGPFNPSYLTDFMCAALGTENGKKFRKWIEKGGGPPRPDDPDDDKAEIELFENWLGWFEGLELYGTITHSEPDRQGRIWANFAGPMPIGSLPNQPEPDYQALCRGKARALVQEGGPVPDAEPAAKPVPVMPGRTEPVTVTVNPPKRTYDQVFDDKDDIPF